MKIIIYTPTLNARTKYIFNFIFVSILRTEISVTSDKNTFLKSIDFKLNYSENAFADEFFFKNSGLLDSNHIDSIKLKTIPFADYHVPFPIKNSALPFDVFATSFFILTRYEEYLHYQTSNTDFKVQNSYQYKWKILNKPIIDEWALILKNLILKKEPNYTFNSKQFYNQPTINLKITPDIPKGIFPKTKRLIGAVFNQKENYFHVMFNNFIGLDVNAKNAITEINDKEISANAIFFVGLPLDVKEGDFYSNSIKLLKTKTLGLLRTSHLPKTNIKSSLKIISSTSATNSSQQLQTLKLPDDYINLLNAGINNDFSMGYDDQLGFRAGTCTPFFWFDLQLDKVTTLNVKPFCLSDTAIHKLNPEKAQELIKECIDSIKFVNGHLYSSWQLKSLSKKFKHNKWHKFYNHTINYIG